MNKLVVKSIRWDITNRCNLSCIHCFCSKNNESDIKFSQIVKIITKIMLLGLKEINFSGREPTLRKDMFRIIKLCCENGIKVNMTTNATLFDQAMIERIAKSAINMLVISLDGPNAESHDRIRGQGNFIRTIENLNNLKSRLDRPLSKIRIGISCTLQRSNIDSIHEMIDLCNKLGGNLLAINPVSFCGSALNAVSDLYIPSDKIMKAWEQICAHYKDCNSNFELYLGVYPMEAKYLNMKYNLDLPVIHTGCSAGQTLYIDPQGRALPCYMLPPVSEIVPAIGKYVKYWDILNESVIHAEMLFKPFVKFALHHDHRDFKGCESCPDVEVCKRCPLISLSDPEAIRRCQKMRDCIEKIIPKCNDESSLRIKPTIKYQLLNNKLLINIKDGSYTCEKTYELEPFAKAVWNEIVKHRSMRQINETTKRMHSKLSTKEKKDNLHECIDYFLKEGIITINGLNEKEYLD